MENAKQMLADIKGKLDELETELEQLEARGVRIDEYHELADMDADGQGNWQQLDRDLKDLNNDLYGAN